jgi:hypothetical protein
MADGLAERELKLVVTNHARRAVTVRAWELAGALKQLGETFGLAGEVGAEPRGETG